MGFKLRYVPLIIIAIVIVLVAVPLLIHFFTWGLPWEQEKAMEAGQAYVDSNFDEPMEVISANRFLRGEYNVIVKLVDYDDFRFTVSFDSELQFWKHDFEQRVIQYKLRQVIQSLVSEISPDASATIIIVQSFSRDEIDEFNGKITMGMPIEELMPIVEGRYAVSINYPQNVTIDNTDEAAPIIYSFISALKEQGYQATYISFYPQNSLGPREYHILGEDPSLVLSLTFDEYMEIQNPEDLIPHFETEIERNPYYK